MVSEQPSGGDERTEEGVVQELRDSPLDIVVLPAKGDDVFVKVGGQALLLDRMEADTLADEIKTKLKEDDDGR